MCTTVSKAGDFRRQLHKEIVSLAQSGKKTEIYCMLKKVCVELNLHFCYLIYESRILLWIVFVSCETTISGMRILLQIARIVNLNSNLTCCLIVGIMEMDLLFW